MTYDKTILCLANSRKPPSGRCVAGKEIDGDGYGHWIRPVSDRQGQEISEEERRFESGKKVQVLDVVTVPMIEPRPMRHQTENHLIDGEYYWTKVSVATWKDVQEAVDTVNGPLWINGYSTYHGLNDKIPENLVKGLKSSLMLMRVPDLSIEVGVESGFEGRPGRRRVRAVFKHSGHDYSIVVSDPEFEDTYFAKKNGQYELEGAIVCFSLTELIYGHAFKLAAAVFTEDRCEGAS